MAEVAALYTGTFDPLTHGHADVIRQAARLCGRLIVAIGVHPGKKPLFSLDEKSELIHAATRDISASSSCEIVVASFSALAVDAARENGATLLLRGLRDGTDFDYEMQMAGMNRAMAPGVRSTSSTN